MLVYGIRTVYELLKTSYEVEVVYLEEGFNNQELLELLKASKVKVVSKKKAYLNNLVTEKHQGVIAKIQGFKFSSVDLVLKQAKSKQYPLIVLLDQITDINNFASIIRVCECVGVDGIVILKNRSVTINEKVLKISSGAAFNMKIAVVSNLSNTLAKLKENGFWIVGSDLQTDSYYTSVDYKMPVGLIIGSEGEGIRTTTRKHCDFLVKIPMVGNVNSLNASVATGILCYEIFNSRKEV